MLTVREEVQKDKRKVKTFALNPSVEMWRGKIQTMVDEDIKKIRNMDCFRTREIGAAR